MQTNGCGCVPIKLYFKKTGCDCGLGLPCGSLSTSVNNVNKYLGQNHTWQSSEHVLKLHTVGKKYCIDQGNFTALWYYKNHSFIYSEFSIQLKQFFYISSKPENDVPVHNRQKVENKQCTSPMCVVIHFPERLYPECCLQFQSSVQWFYLQGLKAKSIYKF